MCKLERPTGAVHCALQQDRRFQIQRKPWLDDMNYEGIREREWGMGMGGIETWGYEYM
jgi:hypothetical protein